MTKEDALRDLAYKAWSFARNAHRLYPDNKHAFSDYSSTTLKEDMKEAEAAVDQYAEQESQAFAEWGSKEGWGLYKEVPAIWIKNDGSEDTMPTTSELYNLYKQTVK